MALGLAGAAGATLTCGDDSVPGTGTTGTTPDPARGTALPARDGGTDAAAFPGQDAAPQAAPDAATAAAVTCTDPLPESQLPDDTGHEHTLSIPAATLGSTFEHTFTTSVTQAHSHKVALSVPDFGNLRGGETVLLPSTPAAADGHYHIFAVTCV